MKKIFFRIIVAVAVAFILSKMKLLGIMKVNALSVSSTNYSSFCVYTNRTSSLCDSTLTKSTYYTREWYGYTYLGDVRFSNVSVILTLPNIPINKPFYLSGLVMLIGVNTESTENPIRAYVDIDNRSYVCEVSTLVNNNESTISTISCPNVITSNRSIRLFLDGPFMNYSGRYAFSEFVGVYDDDLLIAQNQTNNHLNDLKNSINSTNAKLDELIRQMQQQNQTQTQIQNNTKETNDLIKDDSSISNDKITDITNIDTNTSNTPVSDFITLPITLLNKYNTSMNSSCNSINLGSLLGTDLIIPCINLEQRLGSNLWSIIDKLFSFFMVFNIAMFCISIFERLTSLHDDFYSAYDPQHAYNGKHGGGS